MKLINVGLIIILLNIPFGYWRANVRKFSMQWIFAVHLPVPFVIALRFLSGIGFAFITYPILVSAFFLGQFAGAKLHVWWKKNLKTPATSCLPCDLFNFLGFNND